MISALVQPAGGAAVGPPVLGEPHATAYWPDSHLLTGLVKPLPQPEQLIGSLERRKQESPAWSVQVTSARSALQAPVLASFRLADHEHWDDSTDPSAVLLALEQATATKTIERRNAAAKGRVDMSFRASNRRASRHGRDPNALPPRPTRQLRRDRSRISEERRLTTDAPAPRRATIKSRRS